MFLGYNDKYKCYRCFYPPTGRVYISRHVLFDEMSFSFATVYSNAHNQAVTPSYEAWQRSLIPPLTVQSDKTTCANVPVVSSTVRLPTLPTNSLFTEADFPPLQHSLRVAGSNETVTTTTSISGTDLIGTSANQTSQSQPQHNVPASTSQHSMITRARAGIRKPNPKFAL